MPAASDHVYRNRLLHVPTNSGREHYRVNYPSEARPVLWLEGEEYSLLDVSENGVRFQSPSTRIVT